MNLNYAYRLNLRVVFLYKYALNYYMILIRKTFIKYINR